MQPDLPAHAADGDAVDAIIDASRLLVAGAARAVVGQGETLSLPQYRLLVVLGVCGSLRGVDLAEEFGVHASTAGRMAERLSRKGLVARASDPDDRRVAWFSLTSAGRQLLDEVDHRRRVEITALWMRLTPVEREEVDRGLRHLTRLSEEAFLGAARPWGRQNSLL